MSDLPIAGASNPHRSPSSNEPQGVRELYRYIEPSSATPPSHYKLYETTYRGLKITRLDDNFYLWTILTKDDKEPAVALRGRYTKIERAKAAIDDYLKIDGKFNYD
jgi:hypothetical protein